MQPAVGSMPFIASARLCVTDPMRHLHAYYTFMRHLHAYYRHRMLYEVFCSYIANHRHVVELALCSDGVQWGAV